VIRYEAICDVCNSVLVAVDNVEIVATNIHCPVDPSHPIMIRKWRVTEERDA